VSTHLLAGVPILPQNFGGCQAPATKNPTNCGVFGAPKFYHKILGGVKRPQKYPTWAWGLSWWTLTAWPPCPIIHTSQQTRDSKTSIETLPERMEKKVIRFCPVHVKQHLPILLGKDFMLDFESRNKKEQNPTLDSGIATAL